MLGGAASAAGLVVASVLNRLVMEPFEFISQMQNAALEVSYHQVIRRRTGQTLRDLFRGFSVAVQDQQYDQVSPRFSSKLCIRFEKTERARYGKVEELLGYFLKRYPKASALLWRSRSPSSSSLLQHLAFQNGNRRMSLTSIRQNCCPFCVRG